MSGCGARGSRIHWVGGLLTVSISSSVLRKGLLEETRLLCPSPLGQSGVGIEGKPWCASQRWNCAQVRIPSRAAW